MIVNKNINPERDLYYLGGKVIEILQDIDGTEFDYFEVFQRLNSQKSISLNLYILVLDWLFLLKAIKKGKNGILEKCF